MIKELRQTNPLPPEAETAFRELYPSVKCINYVRNSVIHAVMVDDQDGVQMFHLHSKKRLVAKEHVFASEELTNYAAHAALALRMALGVQGSPAVRHPLPDRPDIPEFLRSNFQELSRR